MWNVLVDVDDWTVPYDHMSWIYKFGKGSLCVRAGEHSFGEETGRDATHACKRHLVVSFWLGDISSDMQLAIMLTTWTLLSSLAATADAARQPKRARR